MRGTNTITFKIHNNGLLNLVQNELDGTVFVNRWEKEDGYTKQTEISAGDMVMLVNLYRYIKENDIQNDFINPNGKNKED